MRLELVFSPDTVDFDPSSTTFNLVSKGLKDVFILKLNANGELIWAKSIGGVESDFGNAVDIDQEDNVYTSGSFSRKVDFNPNAGKDEIQEVYNGDAFVLKLDKDGEYLWARTVGSLGPESGNDLVIDNSQNVIIAGSFDGTADFDPESGVKSNTNVDSDDIFILKLDSSGSLVWVKTVGGDKAEKALSVAVDGFGNIYTAGFFWSEMDFNLGPDSFKIKPAMWGDGFTLKLNSSSEFQWVSVINGSRDVDQTAAIASDAIGNSYATGHFQGTIDFDPGVQNKDLISNGSRDCFIQKLKTDRLATEKIEDYQISVYPNPTNDLIFLDVPKHQVDLKFRMFTSIGRQLMKIDIDFGKSFVDISDLPNGLYFVSLEDFNGNVFHSQRVIKQ